MIMPEVLIVENYRTMSHLGLVDTILGIGLPYMASAFGIFLLRQTFKPWRAYFRPDFHPNQQSSDLSADWLRDNATQYTRVGRAEPA